MKCRNLGRTDGLGKLKLRFPENLSKYRVGMSSSMLHSFGKLAVISRERPPIIDSQSPIVDLPKPISKRRLCAIIVFVLPIVSISSLSSSVALARERRNRKIIAPEDYLTSQEGLKYYDIVEGKGPVAVNGSIVQVHFDCVYRGITAVSSRESKLLAGNRSIAQPYEFIVGSPPGRERKREFVDNPNGLFSAQAAPKPPPALYFITEGMRVGGKRTVIVPPESGYGQRGSNEIPPGAMFNLNIELLQLIPPAVNK